MEHGAIIYDEDLLGWAKLTVGCFYNRSGKEIDGKGINPELTAFWISVNYINSRV